MKVRFVERMVGVEKNDWQNIWINVSVSKTPILWLDYVRLSAYRLMPI